MSGTLIAGHPTRTLDVGIIGLGALGAGLARLIEGGLIEGVFLSTIVVREPGRYRAAWPALASRITTGKVAKSRAHLPDILVEAAGHQAVRGEIEGQLRSGVDVIIASVGALADDALYQRLKSAATAGGSILEVTNGGIAGLDGLASARYAGLRRVIHEVRKPPEAILDAFDAAAVRASGHPRELLRDTARVACGLYPRNLNVVAAVAMSGLGFDDTEVVISADPSVDRNVHRVTATGDFGEFVIEVSSRPTAENPRTGQLAIGGLARTLAALVDRRRQDSV